MTMTLDEALLCLNDRLGDEVTAWVEVLHEQPLLIATGLLRSWSQERTSGALQAVPDDFDLRGRYLIGEARFDLSDAPVESVGERPNGMTFRLAGGARLVVTWQPHGEDDLVA